MSSVRLDGVSKSFGETTVIADLNLTVADGEFLTLVGPSGCGKSTLLRIIAGLEEQTSGSVAIGNTVVDRIRSNERDLAMVFQSYALYPHLSVFDNIAVPLRMRWMNTWQRLPVLRRLIPGVRKSEEKIRSRVKETAATLGLEHLLDRKPGQLSGGQRQRVAVGRAIVRDPAAFLFDEPLSNLDAKLRVHMRAEITQLHRQLGATFIYVTHDQAEAMTMSDRIAVMMEGELVQIGSPDEIYQDPRDVRVAEFIGSPKINLLEATAQENCTVTLQGNATGVQLSSALEGNVRIGVRPENLHLSAPGEGVCDGRVELLENLGAEVLVHLEVTDQADPVVVRLMHRDAGQIKLGEKIDLTFDPIHALVFDSDGQRVEMAQDNIEVLHG